MLRKGSRHCLRQRCGCLCSQPCLILQRDPSYFREQGAGITILWCKVKAKWQRGHVSFLSWRCAYKLDFHLLMVYKLNLSFSNFSKIRICQTAWKMARTFLILIVSVWIHCLSACWVSGDKRNGVAWSVGKLHFPFLGATEAWNELYYLMIKYLIILSPSQATLPQLVVE